MKRTLLFPLLLAVLVPLGWAQEKDKKQQSENKRQSYAAVVVGTGGAIGGRTLNLNINIDRFTSDQEVQEYITLLKEEGQDALRKRLEKITVGRVAPVATTGTDLSIARVFQTEEGKVIRVMTPRPVPFFEAYRHGYGLSLYDHRTPAEPGGKRGGFYPGCCAAEVQRKGSA
jgi:hypothetical protein